LYLLPALAVILKVRKRKLANNASSADLALVETTEFSKFLKIFLTNTKISGDDNTVSFSGDNFNLVVKANDTLLTKENTELNYILYKNDFLAFFFLYFYVRSQMILS